MDCVIERPFSRVSLNARLGGDARPKEDIPVLCVLNPGLPPPLRGLPKDCALAGGEEDERARPPSRSAGVPKACGIFVGKELRVVGSCKRKATRPQLRN